MEHLDTSWKQRQTKRNHRKHLSSLFCIFFHFSIIHDVMNLLLEKPNRETSKLTEVTVSDKLESLRAAKEVRFTYNILTKLKLFLL